MGDDTLIGRLESSEAYRSITAELEVASVLRAHGWKTTHGHYYVDPDTDKVRELDLWGHRLFRVRQPDDEEQFVHLLLPVEVKSANGYHLLLAGGSGSSRVSDRHVSWFGYQAERHPERLAGFLGKLGLERSLAAELTGRFRELAYPNETARVRGSSVEPPRPRYYFSAFRETNIGGTKTLGNSVFWRANMALKSAVRSKKSAHVRGCYADVRTDIRAAMLFDQPISSYFESGAIRLLNVLLSFHPVVVVTDAQLWRVSDGMQQTDSARFYEAGTPGFPTWWVDIVTRDGLKGHIRLLTDHYVSALATDDP